MFARAMTTLTLSILLASQAHAQAGGGGDVKFPSDKPAPKSEPGKAPKPANEPASVDLRPKWEKGQRIGYVMTIKSESDAGGLALPDPTGGPAKKPNPTTMDQEITLLLNVVESDAEKGATVELVYTKMKVKLKSDAMEMDFDSSKPAKAPAKKSNDPLDQMLTGDAGEQALRDMIGEKMTMVVAPDGSIKSVTGGDKLAMGGLIGQLTGGAGAGAQNVAQGLIGPIVTKKSGGGVVRVGERWTNADGMSVGPFGEIEMKTDHTVRSISNNMADVMFKGGIEPKSLSQTSSPMQLRDVNYTGRYLWDAARGQLAEMTSEQSSTIELKAAGMSGTHKNKQLVSVKRMDKPPAMPSK
jgi:hypothetical protein